ncbi:hypothetical protein SERLA73DRAFT_192195 [Serpula lacrymans var. lacrymans S7.3]|uniref:Uncharacterized protein n=2 Tax=Serpula lacrymans var. lacrymans TaxID=341189 RepID=F8QJ88_SERL3|nr:uncharacterized protein SERLADRAFT_481173 [Serpula lacrymans var. lacrymans S7.9]EGN91631.1 hypothetical protein SERLA73DRAFT_192195 [Serpula lacrymans var. lacrymans S7.3]EGO18391.1 hypothetical protein SERLADRAFT_481173 [Serpula lacrymans var. lacrymans S7.9]
MGSGRFSLILHNIYSTLFRPPMSRPKDIVGLFQPGLFGPVGPESWGSILLLVDETSRCYIDRIVFCKCKKDKKHEFLLIHVRRHTITGAQKAFIVVDRAPRAPEGNNASVQSPPASGIASPSVSDTTADDRVSTCMENDKEFGNLTAKYKPYATLCELDFLPSVENHLPPSVRQLSVLLTVVNHHAPLYNLYEHQCYWFANTVFDMLKKLFPNAEEKCTSHDIRGNYHGLKFDHRNSIETITEEYDRSWIEACNRVREERIKQEETRRKHVEDGMKIGEERGIKIGEEHGRAEREQLKAEMEQQKAESARREAEKQAELDQLKARMHEDENRQSDNAAVAA